MWYVITAKTFDGLEVAENRLKTHGLFIGKEYLERVYMGNDREPGVMGHVGFYMENRTGCQDTWLQILLGDVCVISTVETLQDTVTIDEAINKVTNEYPTPKGSYPNKDNS